MGEGRKYRSQCGLPHNALHLLISADHPWHNEGSGRVPAISMPKSFPPYAAHWMHPFRSVCSVTPSTRGLSACPNAHSQEVTESSFQPKGSDIRLQVLNHYVHIFNCTWPLVAFMCPGHRINGETIPLVGILGFLAFKPG